MRIIRPCIAMLQLPLYAASPGKMLFNESILPRCVKNACPRTKYIVVGDGHYKFENVLKKSFLSLGPHCGTERITLTFNRNMPDKAAKSYSTQHKADPEKEINIRPVIIN
ncbi:hypothetical protein AVEN_231203-1 [Araneus ventricosus]|uniref:Uncharacterized protein n=1 Tax=Araneus ventricosus TaxID=182803 RepID=A0A4Y2GWK1_ARAVE|nr:hypothetical protein AVEN_231203-1 [Araneus ventricosus]